MSAEKKTSGKTDQAVGKVKEVAGKITDNPRLEDEGRTQQTKGDLKQAGEKIKDAFKH
jgi:uncharacterized protein YjbJ (UPF0337 family)